MAQYTSDASPPAIREIVYGGIDGIITTFAVVSGFSGAHLSAETAVSLSVAAVLLFGFANLFADGVSMGLGNFLSMRSERELYAVAEDREREFVRNDSGRAADETADILRRQGFSDADAGKISEIYQRNTSYWVSFLLREKLQLLSTADNGIVKKSFAIFFSFIIFGCIPIIPFVLSVPPDTAFLFSIIGALAALTALGIVRACVTGERWYMAIGEVVVVGVVAGSIAFFVGSLFTGVV